VPVSHWSAIACGLRWAWFGLRIVNKSTCPLISHRRESPTRRLRALINPFNRAVLLLSAELTVTLASLTRHNDNNDNEYDIAVSRRIKLAAVAGAGACLTLVTLLHCCCCCCDGGSKVVAKSY